MAKIIRLTEADLTRLVSRVIKEQSKVMTDKVASSSSSKKYNTIASCASMGVKSIGYCYVDTKKPITNPAPNIGKTLN